MVHQLKQMNGIDNIPEFGIKRENEERRDGGCAVVFDPEKQKYAVGRQYNNGRLRLFSGGVDDLEEIKEGVLREVREESGLSNFLYVEKIGEVNAHYYNSLKGVNRVARATCFLVILANTNLIPVKLEEHEKFELVWVTAVEMFNDLKLRNENNDNDHWIYFFEKAIKRAQIMGYDKSTRLFV